MSRSKPFHFKQFSVEQDRCAMKVGTDGVLLGGWASLENQPDSILDIGAGTGLIALMLAQRGNAETIDALEIDEAAYEQCIENFEASPWGDRLFCYHAGLDEFVEEWEDTYDLIVCNPPFLEPRYPLRSTSKVEKEISAKSPREKARFYDALPFEELLEGTAKLLAKDGCFTTVIPFKKEKNFLDRALQLGLYPQRITNVKGNPSSKIKRSLLQFGFDKTEIETDELTIELERHEYTPEYISLTKDFYLKM